MSVLNTRWLYSPILLIMLLLGGCINISAGAGPNAQLYTLPAVHDLYCDRYLIYDMCALDVDSDGTADALYFEDTKEVFMYDKEHELRIVGEFGLHPCAQIMDQEMKGASNRLLTISDFMPLSQKLGIKKQLFSSYRRYSPKVDACQSAIASRDETPFGDPDDLGF
ncbi:hypothetical protein HBA55_35570 [Pseudomaricurvus alkylphenolicus]|uniref:hypothetical protein n=1 Tax=Pseudomaricurvus alkylphenolicus TaxID=1306991 RepID=UPI0014245828|nr:hypothetical protein [Pseudomaricurvus alkylphenolicus]NIB44953.1 hypothetical protein [Pseudomaricurvus alkylphenolicus]